jgi:hypothetical protein
VGDHLGIPPVVCFLFLEHRLSILLSKNPPRGSKSKLFLAKLSS